MSSLNVFVTTPITLAVKLWDEAANKYVRARIYNESNAEIVGSPVSLLHQIDGLYTAMGPNMPSEYLSVVFKVYNDVLFTDPSVCHLPGSLCLMPSKECLILAKLNEIQGQISGTLGSFNPIDVIIDTPDITVFMDSGDIIVESDVEEISVSHDENLIEVGGSDSKASDVVVEKCE